MKERSIKAEIEHQASDELNRHQPERPPQPIGKCSLLREPPRNRRHRINAGAFPEKRVPLYLDPIVVEPESAPHSDTHISERETRFIHVSSANVKDLRRRVAARRVQQQPA